MASGCLSDGVPPSKGFPSKFHLPQFSSRRAAASCGPPPFRAPLPPPFPQVFISTGARGWRRSSSPLGTSFPSWTLCRPSPKCAGLLFFLLHHKYCAKDWGGHQIEPHQNPFEGCGGTACSPFAHFHVVGICVFVGLEFLFVIYKSIIEFHTSSPLLHFFFFRHTAVGCWTPVQCTRCGSWGLFSPANPQG